MDNFPIVFEAPQDGQTRKKRARLVTSCDHCRLKKIKCVQSRNSSKCEACANARIACRYNDRAQYFAERGRIMSSNNSSSTRHRASKRGGSESHISVTILDPFEDRLSTSPPSSVSSGPSSPDICESPLHSSSHSWSPPRNEDHCAGLSASPEQSWHTASYHASAAQLPSKGSYQSNIGLHGTFSDMPSIDQHALILPLFDPQWPDRPHPTLMMQFIQTYFDHYGPSFPCLAYDETIRQFLEQSLSPVIATGIAALAAWYSDLPEVVRRGAADVSAAYCGHAKALVSRDNEHPPSIETIHGLVLVAWAEYKRARMPDFCAHVRKAKFFAEQLGLTDGSLIALATNDYDRHILQSTWGVLRQLVTTVETWSG
ncbi:hypothetical protein WOLCODRAFT_138429 [Wolfiporia cocos MD-104 SS10]|uniref:Zn(2)-C6 fungal-type domain-containing protein n=1 Tax=Wolfiporia cocos (strain MD-104) TaxID=742152 RepID=A0A2H3JN07_WOLCO|nr:hypothetical protein WOLCODRAFT_138429 [Wolfiporia cocos MD-104 SS10]